MKNKNIMVIEIGKWTKFFIEMIIPITIIFFFWKGCIAKEVIDPKSKLGQTFILDNDTLTIINYSRFEGTYTLSNGVIISKELVK